LRGSFVSPSLLGTMMGSATSPSAPYDPPSSSMSRQISSGGKSYWTSGRPPWYDRGGSANQPFVIGVAGGTSSGKTTVCHKIVEELNIPWAVLLSQDSFYKVLNQEEIERAERAEYNFDHPDSFDYELLVDTLARLKKGQRVQVPIYDFVTHSRRKSSTVVYGADVILFEGILAFYDKRLLDLMDLKIFVDADSDIRLARRLRRDITFRGRDIHSVIKQYRDFVKPSFDEYIAPTQTKADIIIPNGEDSTVAIDLIVQHIKLKLQQREHEFRGLLLTDPFDEDIMPESVNILPNHDQIKAIHTQLRDRTTSRDDFIFLATRLGRLLVEHSLSLLPFHARTVKTPTNWNYEGMKGTDEICGVSIMRAGESMEIALREVCKDICIGKILIQSDPSTSEPAMIYCKLPTNISTSRVLLMDPMIGTGATAMMAIRVLLDHNVPEENILFLTLMAAPIGVHTIAYAFPHVKIITTSVEDRVNELYYILPGVGNFGDRYFGTDDPDLDTEPDVLILPPPASSQC